MPLDYLNEASDEVQRLFARLDDVERMLRMASEERRPMIGEERYLTGEEVCTRLHLSPRTLQTLRDRRQIPFTVLGNRLLLYPESGSGRRLIATFGQLPSNRLHELSNQMIRGLFFVHIPTASPSAQRPARTRNRVPR